MSTELITVYHTRITLLSHLFNAILVFSFGLFFVEGVLENLNHETELKADCVVRETPNAINQFGTGKENRPLVIDFVTKKCGVSPYQIMP